MEEDFLDLFFRMEEAICMAGSAGAFGSFWILFACGGGV